MKARWRVASLLLARDEVKAEAERPANLDVVPGSESTGSRAQAGRPSGD